mgnify:CR=1 FL=1
MTTSTAPDVLDGRVALITGGAAGIGRAIAQAYAARGVRCVLVDVAADAVAETAAQIPHAIGIAADVSSPSQSREAVAQAVGTTGRLDILVNSAGVGAIRPALELTEEDWDRTVDINMKGTFFMCQAAGAHMLQAGYGRVINIASKCGTIAIADHAAYSASKFGVIGLSKVLAVEWSSLGVTVNTISPTVVLTELGKKVWHGDAAEQMLAKIPARRFATPEDVAHAAVFLASDSGIVTGHDLLVDGGYVAQ